MAKTPVVPVSFEKALGELEAIVQGMESGKYTLEEALLTYQRGVELLKHCQGILSAAEQQVEFLEAQLQKKPEAGAGDVTPS